MYDLKMDTAILCQFQGDARRRCCRKEVSVDASRLDIGNSALSFFTLFFLLFLFLFFFFFPVGSAWNRCGLA